MSYNEQEKIENSKYKDFIKSELNNSKAGSFCPFRHEKQLDYILPKIKVDFENGHKLMLDLCCGYGRLTHFINEEFPLLNIHGIDYMPEFIEEAKKRFEGKNNICFELGNAMELSDDYEKKFDSTIVHKTVSWLPYYENIMKEAIRVTKEKIYITSLFWEGDIDFISKVYKNASTNHNDTFVYLNTYSFPKFKKFCIENGAKELNMSPMNIDIDLMKNSDANILTTYTESLKDGSRLELTGTIMLNWKLIEIIL